MGASACPPVNGEVVAGVAAGFGIAVPVGAVATYLVALTARTSLRTGVAAALGVATADGLYAVLAAVGGGWLAGWIAPVAGPLRWASALVLLALAVRGGVGAIVVWRRGGPGDGRDGEVVRPARAYGVLLGVTLVNPTTVVYFTALVLGGRSSGGGWSVGGGVVFAGAAFAASASWQVLLAGGGALLGRALTGARGRLVTGLASATVIVVLAVRMLV